jgi:phosphatidylserine/phosphatidylglycerophosphate/cardiolipin synthase-like enzyme
VYVHAKVAVFDDVWAAVGSANLNRRSWSHDSELTAAVLDDTRDTRDPVDPAGRGDGARVFARDLRLGLMREHLDRAPGDDADLLDPTTRWRPWRSPATALDRWHRGGRVGPRPPGQLRTHDPETDAARDAPVGHAALPRVYDPDGRSLPDRWRGRW